jgi:hypothetical protein
MYFSVPAEAQHKATELIPRLLMETFICVLTALSVSPARTDIHFRLRYGTPGSYCVSLWDLTETYCIASYAKMDSKLNWI